MSNGNKYFETYTKSGSNVIQQNSYYYKTLVEIVGYFKKHIGVPNDYQVVAIIEDVVIEGRELKEVTLVPEEYSLRPEESPLGAKVYIGTLGKVNYMTTGGRIRQISSFDETVRRACKNYRSNGAEFSITVSGKAPKGLDVNVADEIRKLLRSMKAYDVVITQQSTEMNEETDEQLTPEN